MTSVPIRAAAPTAVLWCLLLGGCSTYERDWKAMGTGPAAAAGVEGRWSGTWLSDVNGHDGTLRCMIRASESGGYDARYRATWGWFFTFEYAMPMTVREEGETYLFSAEADLGWLAGGLYEYEGTVVGDEFTSTYRSKGDHGTFRMTRVR